MLKKIQIYSDGACRGNPGPGGWGVLLIYDGTEKEIYGGELETTNNRMELMAAIVGMESIKYSSDIIITTDSKTKNICIEVKTSKGMFKIGGVAKGSGMIHPKMGTMLGYITTDALVDSKTLTDTLKNSATKRELSEEGLKTIGFVDLIANL